MVEDEDRQMGLMFRPSLPADRAMLFVFESPDFHGIWMKNCKFPIDIVWLDENAQGRTRRRSGAALQEGPVPRLPAACSGRSYVVEMNAGQARKEKAVMGSAVSFDLPR